MEISELWKLKPMDLQTEGCICLNSAAILEEFIALSVKINYMLDNINWDINTKPGRLLCNSQFLFFQNKNEWDFICCREKGGKSELLLLCVSHRNLAVMYMCS